ncbi:MAG: cupin domain-containing protein [Candidatus Eremiobacteraeota bacterium]|nr:cupin domain-containing protein [Candidatus Eremiobacteraeota bacterium]
MRNVKDANGFAVLENGRRVQTAVMALEPGQASGPLGNEHPSSEQVLFVVDGEVEAVIGSEQFTMHAGDSAIVPPGTPHRFVNGAARPALTFNVYSPKAY